MNRMINFLREVRVELSKVSWPSREQLLMYTLAVIGISLFLAAFLGLLDSGFTYLLDKVVLQ